MIVGGFVGFHVPAVLLWLFTGNDPWSWPAGFFTILYAPVGMCIGLGLGLLFGCAAIAKWLPETSYENQEEQDRLRR